MKWFLFILFGLFSSLSFANMGDNIVISPLIISAEMNPGQTKIFEIKLDNQGSYDLINYDLELAEFNIGKDQYTIDLKNKNQNNRSVIKYSKILNKEDLKILPKNKKTIIKIEVTIPKDYTKGSGFFVYKLFKNIDKKSNFIGFQKSISGLFTVDIKNTGTVFFKMKEKEVSLKNKEINLSISNDGDKIVDLNAKAVFIKNGKIITSIQLLDFESKEKTSANVYPDSSRKFFAKIPNSVSFTKKDKSEVLFLVVDSKNNKTISEKIKIND